MKNELFVIPSENKRAKKRLVIFVTLLIINILCAAFSIYYFGYYKPHIITFNISINAYKSQTLNTLLYTNSFIILSFNLIQTIFLFLNLTYLYKEQVSSNKKCKISKMFLIIASIITVILILSHLLLEYLNNSSDTLMTFLCLALMICLYAMTFSFLRELNSYFNKQNEMRDYL